MVYICPGGNCTGIAIFFFDKVSHLKHPSVGRSSIYKSNGVTLAIVALVIIPLSLNEVKEGKSVGLHLKLFSARFQHEQLGISYGSGVVRIRGECCLQFKYDWSSLLYRHDLSGYI